MNRYLFEEARKLYPGRVRGGPEEWDDFRKKYGMKVSKICPLLVPAIEKQIKHREECAEKEIWCPQWKNFKTWYNGKWWTEEIPQTKKPKPKKCEFCGKPATQSEIEYFDDGARTVFRCYDCPDRAKEK